MLPTLEHRRSDPERADGPAILDRFDSGGASMSSDGAHWHQRLRPHLFDADVGDLERALWVVVAFSLVGDVATTFAGLHLGLAESNPVARGAIDGYGILGMLVLKAFAIGVGLVCRRLLDRPFRPIVPAALAVPWMAAVFVNLYMISLAF